MKNAYKNIGNLVKNKRLRLGMSQSKLAYLVGHTGQFISNIERATCSIPFEKLPEYMTALELSSFDVKMALHADLDDALMPYLKQFEASQEAEKSEARIMSRII
jgi:transcriptional regulator with XRE-family HTH domain